MWQWWTGFLEVFLPVRACSIMSNLNLNQQAFIQPLFVPDSRRVSKQLCLDCYLRTMLRISLCSVAVVPCFQTNYCASVCIKWHLPSAAKSLGFSFWEIKYFSEYLMSPAPHVWSVRWLTREGQSWRETRNSLCCRLTIPCSSGGSGFGLCRSKYSSLLLAEQNWLCSPCSYSALAAFPGTMRRVLCRDV